MVDALQNLTRDLAYTLHGNLMVEVDRHTPEEFSRLIDRAEILAEWDPDDDAPEDGYEVLFTNCDGCDRLVIPVIEGTADLESCRWCASNEIDDE